MPKARDPDFKSPLKKLKEDLLGKHSTSSTVSTSSSSHFDGSADMFLESFSHDDHQLRRPMNAFLLFCKRHRAVVRTRHPWLDNRACTKMLADMWGALDGEEKEKYLQLARECKAAFMKAHPDYRWSGPNKHSGKVTNPGTITPRTHALGRDDDDGEGGGTQGDSSAGITIGKLADPSQMGGLSLLLLAGQQETTPKPQPKAAPSYPGSDEEAPSHDKLKTVRRSNSEPASSPAKTSTSESEDSIKSTLFQFAEMCSDQLAIKSEDESPSAESSLDTANLNNNNTIALHSDKHTKLTAASGNPNGKASKRSSSKKSQKSLPLSPNKNSETGESADSEASTKERTEIEGDGKMKQDEKTSEKEEEEGKKMMGSGKKKKVKSKRKKKKKKGNPKEDSKAETEKSAKEEEEEKKKDILSVSWPGALKIMIKKRADEENDQANGDSDGNDGKKVRKEESRRSEGEESNPSGQRKSRRSCKGQLYRKLVDQGMLESLQRPERPFNCKKAWRHTNEGMSGFSDAEDEVFEPVDDRPRKPGGGGGGGKRWRSRKRTSSGSSINATDFDYGEINVEARLATLPQYKPEQFRTKRKLALKAKQRSDLYKNAKFIKENIKAKNKPVRTVSASEVPSSVSGSRKRKASKASIMHLLPSKDAGSIASPATPATQSLSPRLAAPSAPNVDDEVTKAAKVKRSLSDPQAFTLSDLAEAASMELKPCSSTIPSSVSSSVGVSGPSLCLSAVKVS